MNAVLLPLTHPVVTLPWPAALTFPTCHDAPKPIKPLCSRPAATWDNTYGAPICGGRPVCSSGSLLYSRGALNPSEQNAPNSLFNTSSIGTFYASSCQVGWSGGWAVCASTAARVFSICARLVGQRVCCMLLLRGRGRLARGRAAGEVLRWIRAPHPTRPVAVAGCVTRGRSRWCPRCSATR